MSVSAISHRKAEWSLNGGIPAKTWNTSLAGLAPPATRCPVGRTTP
jgi:hypothetical protein